jgi:hypothetical protein
MERDVRYIKRVNERKEGRRSKDYYFGVEKASIFKKFSGLVPLVILITVLRK